MITRPVYASRELVRQTIDIRSTARNDRLLDLALEAGAEAVEACTRRRFYPWEGTRYFDWPDSHYPTPWRLWLDEDEVAEVTSVTSGGNTITYASGQILPYPNQGPPYTRLELDRGVGAAFSGGTTVQRAVAVLGTFCGCPLTTSSAGTIAEALDASETGVEMTTSESVGVGDLLVVDDERMLVTDRAWLTTGLTVQGGGIASGATQVTLTASGSGVSAGEMILVDSERMLVEDVVGATLTVKRAYDGSVLAAHSAGVTVYAPRLLTVSRGSLGTTAASHSSSAAAAVHVPPGLVRELNIGEALNYLVSGNAAWARVIGANEYAKEYTGAGLDALRKQARKAFGRMARTGAV